MGLFDFWKRKNIKMLTSGTEERTEVSSGTSQILTGMGNIESENTPKTNIENENNTQINFSLDSGLMEYDDWLNSMYPNYNKYAGPISIFELNGLDVFVLNYSNKGQQDYIVLATAGLEAKNNIAEIRKNINKKLDSMIRKIYKANLPKRDLEMYLTEDLAMLEENYHLNFTKEGKSVLLNTERKFISANRTGILERKSNSSDMEYKLVDDPDEFNLWQIPDDEKSYVGMTTITVKITKCDIEKLTDQEKFDAVAALEEFYMKAAALGIFQEEISSDIGKYQVMLDLLKNKNILQLLEKGGYADRIREIDDAEGKEPEIIKCTKYAIYKTALNYEDLIEEYVNYPELYESSTEIRREVFTDALALGKEEWYERTMAMYEQQKLEEEKMESKVDEKEQEESAKKDCCTTTEEFRRKYAVLVKPVTTNEQNQDSDKGEQTKEDVDLKVEDPESQL